MRRYGFCLAINFWHFYSSFVRHLDVRSKSSRLGDTAKSNRFSLVRLVSTVLPFPGRIRSSWFLCLALPRYRRHHTHPRYLERFLPWRRIFPVVFQVSRPLTNFFSDVCDCVSEGSFRSCELCSLRPRRFIRSSSTLMSDEPGGVSFTACRDFSLRPIAFSIIYISF